MSSESKINDLIDRVSSGERLSEDEVADVLCSSRDLVLLSIVKKMMTQDFEDMESIELITDGMKSFKRKDIFRIFNVLQNAVERHELKHGAGDDPIKAMQVAWQAAIDRGSVS